MRKISNQLKDIARKHLNVNTLETRNSDRLDFHEVAVWQIEEALRDAYNLGTKSRETR